MELFALLAVCTVIGLSGGTTVNALYGKQQTFSLYSTAHYLYFEAHYRSREVILWTRSKPSQTKRGWYDSSTSRFVIEKLTQADNGKYTMKSSRNNTIGSTYSVTVSHREMSYTRTEGEELQFEFDLELEPYTVTFTFTHHHDSGDEVTDVLYNKGYERYNGFDGRLQFHSEPMYTLVTIEDLQFTDSGVFKILDDKNNLAMMVNLEVEGDRSLPGVIAGWVAGVLAVVVFCCCCLRCCCKKSSKSSEEVPEPADDPPELQYSRPTEYSVMPPLPSYHTEPTPPSASGGPVTVYAYRPADPATGAVKMYSPAPVPFTAPPAQMYSSVPSTAPPAQAPATGSQIGAQGASFASNFLSSETDPCFEMKGMNLAPPLHSECVSADVYTSDKLNFGFL